jgi:hypothetical protein
MRASPGPGHYSPIMSLESDVAAAARSLAEANAASLTPHSLQRHYDREDVTRGIEASGVLEAVEGGLGDVRDSIVGVGALLDLNLGVLARGIALSRQHLLSIEASLRTPLGTSAQERFARGAKAFSRGWLPEAAEEFTAAVRDDPYLAVAHLMHALVLLQEGAALANALPPLLKAIRYATPDEPAVATGAALLAVRVHQQVGDDSAARNLAVEVADSFPDCPDVAILCAEVTGDVARLPRALALAPDLVPVVALKLPEAFNEVSRSGAQETAEMVSGASRIAQVVHAVLQARPTYQLIGEDRALIEALVNTPSPPPELLPAGRMHVRSRAIRDTLRNHEERRRQDVEVLKRDIESTMHRREARRAEIQTLSAPPEAPVPWQMQDLLRRAEFDVKAKEDWITRNGRNADQAEVMARTRAIEESQQKLRALRTRIKRTQETARSRQLRGNEARIAHLQAEQERDPEPLDDAPLSMHSAGRVSDLLRTLNEEISRFPLPGRVVPFAPT